MFKSKVMIARRAKPPVMEQLCTYPHHTCMQPKLDGYEFCIKHILEDKNAPYKQCSYIYPKNGKRCPNATLRLDRKEGCCRIHTTRGPFMRQRTIRKRRPPETPESLVEELDHYNVLGDYFDIGEDLSKELPPTSLVQLPISAPVTRISKIIDYTSDSDSDTEPIVVDQTWRGTVDSDAESIDSEYDDPLKHAGVYTAEETILIARDKLLRLQSLYIKQFKRLQHVMQEKRRNYLHALNQEKELGGPHTVSVATPKEVDQYKKLKALHRYHRKHGVERLLHCSLQEKRKAVKDSSNYKPPSFTKCIQPEKDKKCGQKALPFTKYCLKHILNDSQQLLYKPCSSQGNSSGCNIPTIPVRHLGTCINHCSLPSAMGSTTRDASSNAQQKEEPATTDSLDTLTQSDDVCDIQATDFPSIPSSSLLFGDSSAPGLSEIPGLAGSPHKELWSSSESKLREELESIDLTPGELPPEQLLATN